MLTSIHLLTGAAIGKGLGSVLLTIPLAFISHYILDFIPHYNPKPVKNYKELGFAGADKHDLFLKGIEPIIGIIILIFIIFDKGELIMVMLLGAFFGWLPDFLVYYEWKFREKDKISLFYQIEKKIHRHTTAIRGLIPQAIVLIIVLYFLYN